MPIASSLRSILDRRPALWLLLGVGLIAASQLRYGVDALAWVSWVPFLRFLRLRLRWTDDLAVIGAGMLAMTLATAKIVTQPLPLALAPAFGVPLGLFLTVPLVLFSRVRRTAEARLGPSRHGLVALLFPPFMVGGEWVQHALTEYGSWGAAAHTQLDDLALLQVAAATGLAGVSFVVYLVNAALDHALPTPQEGVPRLGLLGAAAVVVLAAHAYGGLRLAGLEGDTDTVRVAAVGTDATFGGLPLPGPAEQAAIDDGIERRVRLAATQGVELVVWTEAATFVLPEQMEGFVARWAALADELDIEMVAAWIVPVQWEPLRYENVSVTFRPDGSSSAPYLKHHPVPGEPAVVGTAPLPILETSAGRVSTAICYDADFPRLGLAHARNALDLLAVPSSDWRGIDPIHTEMIRLRAIEGGYAVLRSTRLGLSAGIDAAGRMRSFRSAFDSGEPVMVVDLPRTRTWTVYGWLGDWFVALCGAAAGLSLGIVVALQIREAAA